MKQLSEKIMTLPDDQLIEFTKRIPNQKYLFTIAMLDESSRKRLMSVISDKAKHLVNRDLNSLTDEYLSLWS
jgi:hypothetical protein